MAKVRTATLLMISILVLMAPGAQAGTGQEECASPPCGWIAPLLDLLMDDKPPCGSGYLIDDVDPATCMAPPQEGEPIVMSGVFRLYWEVCEEATYLNDASDPIVVSFSGTNRNPSFIDFSIEPSEFVLDTTTLFDPQYIVLTERADGSQTCWYDYRQPITITFTRNGEPSAADLEQIANHNNIAQYHIKMQSDESGERFVSGWGIEPFRFHMDHDSSAKTTPGLGPLALLAALGAAAFVRRQ